MKRHLLLVVLYLTPLSGFCQEMTEKEKYTLFSTYLSSYPESADAKVKKLLIKETIPSGSTRDMAGQVSETCRAAVKGDIAMKHTAEFQYPHLIEVLQQDTLWFALLDELHLKMQKDFRIHHQFTTPIDITVIAQKKIENIFRRAGPKKDGWKKLFRFYPRAYALVELSDVAGDGERALFYTASRRGGLYQKLISLHYEIHNGVWQLFSTAQLWIS